MSSSLLEHLEAINDLVDGLIRENTELKRRLEERSTANKPKLTDREVGIVRDMKRRGFSQKDIADTFDVNPATISRIVRKEYHR